MNFLETLVNFWSHEQKSFDLIIRSFDFRSFDPQSFSISGKYFAYYFQGWEWVFYIQGGACFIWLAAWWILVSDSPAKHPRISKAERAYIENGKFSIGT
jgi:hypothetical protein